MTYTLAPTRTGRPFGVLEIPDSHFPLNLDDKLPAIRELYRRAKATEWNPATDIFWERLDLSKSPEEELFAARQY